MPAGPHNKPNLRGYFGGTGSGKTLSVLEYLRRTKPRRLIVWDPNDEHAELAELPPTMRDLVLAMEAPAWRLRWVPTGGKRATEQAFDAWCDAAFRAVDATVYVEELGSVTTPSAAPDGWRALTTRGRHQALTIIASAQRPAMVDKDFLSNATYIRTTGGFRYAADADAIAKVLRVPLDQVEELERLHWIERDFPTGILKTGRLRP